MSDINEELLDLANVALYRLKSDKDFMRKYMTNKTDQLSRDGNRRYYLIIDALHKHKINVSMPAFPFLLMQVMDEQIRQAGIEKLGPNHIAWWNMFPHSEAAALNEAALELETERDLYLTYVGTRANIYMPDSSHNNLIKHWTRASLSKKHDFSKAALKWLEIYFDGRYSDDLKRNHGTANIFWGFHSGIRLSADLLARMQKQDGEAKMLYTWEEVLEVATPKDEPVTVAYGLSVADVAVNQQHEANKAWRDQLETMPTLFEAVNVLKDSIDKDVIEALSKKDVVLQQIINSLEGTPIMATTVKAVETKTYIFGVLAADVTDDQVFSQIARIEKEIGELNKIDNKPQKLVKRIESMKADIADLMKFVDERE